MIIKSPKDVNVCSSNLLFTSAARLAWGHLLKCLNIQSPYGVLLPAYIGYTEREGSGVFDPIQETNIAYDFYPLNEKLAVDVARFEEMLQTGTFKVALVIHYFGFCKNNINEISLICKKYGVLLVEDCAHAFQLGLKNQSLGIVGDFSFYSLHKYLATDSGGILRINNTSYNFSDVANDQQPSLSVLKQFIRTDVQAVADIRKDNYLKYMSLLQNVSGLEIMYSLETSDVPHNFPVRVKDGKREKLYFFLMDKGITTIALYYRLIDVIKEQYFPISFNVSSEILNLPVHQDTSSEDVELVCYQIKEFFNI